MLSKRATNRQFAALATADATSIEEIYAELFQQTTIKDLGHPRDTG